MILSLLRLGDAERMVAFTVHEPPNPAGDRLDRAETLVFVKEGFSWLAALLTPFWFLFNRMWLVLALYLGGLLLVTSAMAALGVPDLWIALFQFGLNILLGFEADSLKRWTLEQRGWQSIGTVSGRNSAECERRFFETWLPRQPVLRVGEGRPVTRDTMRSLSSGAQGLGGWFGGRATRADA